MKVIFLDVDGVIAPFNKTCKIDDRNLIILKDLVERTESKIVLSSSWRLSYDENDFSDLNLYNIVLSKLKEYDLDIYDITPIKRLRTIKKEYLSSEGKTIINYCFDPFTTRAGEINEWLDKNDVESFVILDDEDHGFRNFSLYDNFVKIKDPTKGLDLVDVDIAINILNHKNRVKTR